MKNKIINNTTTDRLNNLQNYKGDKNTYFIYYISGVIVLAMFLNLAVKTESTDEYYEKYYVLEDYVDNYENSDDNKDGYNDEDIQNKEYLENDDENNGNFSDEYNFQTNLNIDYE